MNSCGCSWISFALLGCRQCLFAKNVVFTFDFEHTDEAVLAVEIAFDHGNSADCKASIAI
jgi:hypothetical protein